MLFGSYVTTRLLLFGFIANLLLRAVWLAYLGISFAFPEGINYKKLKTNQFFKDKLRNQPNSTKRVVILEKWCNLSYSFAVLLTLFSLSLIISMLSIITIANFLGLKWLTSEPSFIYVLLAILVFAQFGILDRILFFQGQGKGILSKLKNTLSNVLSIITLSFLYNREFLVLKTNTNRILLYSFTVVFF